MKHIIQALFISVVVSSCVAMATMAALAPDAAPSPANRRAISEVNISASAPAYVRAAYVSAAKEWCMMDPALCLPVRVVPEARANALFSEKLDPSINGLTYFWPSGETKMVVFELDDGRTRLAAKHELGHALCGCGSHLLAGVMSASPSLMDSVIDRRAAEFIKRRRASLLRGL